MSTHSEVVRTDQQDTVTVTVMVAAVVIVKPDITTDTNTKKLTHVSLTALLTAALVVASRADSPPHQEMKGEEGRFFITGTGNPNQSVVIGNANMVLFGLVVGAFVIALIAAAFTDRGKSTLGYKSA